MTVTGFAGLPTLHRPDPGQQYLFVNGRPVRDKLLLGAVRAAYGDLVPKGRYPLLALFVDAAARRGRRQRASGQGRGALPRRRPACAPFSSAPCATRSKAAGHPRRAQRRRGDARDAGPRALQRPSHTVGWTQARRANMSPGFAEAMQAPFEAFARALRGLARRRRAARARSRSIGRSARPARSCTRPTSSRRRAPPSSSSTSTRPTSASSTSA